jgi:hypothetical protein
MMKTNRFMSLPGPYDAFFAAIQLVTPRYLAIDQGTIAPMIENYRTGLLWNLFMNAAEIGLVKLGFHSGKYNFRKDETYNSGTGILFATASFRRRLLMGK